MKKTIPCFISAALLLLLACKKDSSSAGNTSAIAGNYTFLSVAATTSATAIDNADGTIFKTVTTSAYTSTQNAGSVSITSSDFNANGIGYTIADTAYALSYIDGEFTDSLSSPFGFTYPPTSSSSSYVLVGQDSITYTGANIFAAPGTTGTTGARIAINGNLLIMTTNVIKDTAYTDGSDIISQHETASVITTLQKQ